MALWRALRRPAAFALAAVVATLALYLALGWALAPVLGSQVANVLALGQVLTGVLAIGAAAGVAVYAVEQVNLARQAIAQDQRARAEESAAAAWRVEMALFNELLFDRSLILLQLKGVWGSPLASAPELARFRTSAYDDLLKGGLWTVPLEKNLWAPIATAYTRLWAYAAYVEPVNVPLASSILQSLLLATPERSRSLIGFSSILYVMGAAWWRRRRARQKAEPVVRSLQTALAVLHLELFGTPIEWKALDATLGSVSRKPLPDWFIDNRTDQMKVHKR